MNQRYYSLDVFRGATVCLMILVNNPGSWGDIYGPLEHAPWHGFTPTDLVFPFFLFAVGNAFSFVLPKLEEGGSRLFWTKILKRSALIFLIGLFLNWFPFVRWNAEGSLVFRHWVDPNNPESGVRIFGVLQRIAICYLFAGILIYYLKPAKAFYAAALLLLLYWVLCYTLNPLDPYSLEGWFGTELIDKPVIGIAHLYKGERIPFDPEGIASSIAAIAEVIFGFLIGNYIRIKGKNYEMITGIFIAGIGLLVAGYCWQLVFPVNKKIWTSSFTMVTSGLASLVLATLIYFIEMRNARGFAARFFEVFGKNALFVFAVSVFFPRTLALIRIPDGVDADQKQQFTNPWTWLYDRVFINIPGDPRLGSLCFALSVILLMWFLCYVLDRKKIYIKV